MGAKNMHMGLDGTGRLVGVQRIFRRSEDAAPEPGHAFRTTAGREWAGRRPGALGPDRSGTPPVLALPALTC
ncbi:hypothetical protein GCM10010517_07420 [Streptosporangium fragile]|uniref:Transposase n=1 Tax=Streptosporangium fragile TaxID=46186 RepID=A0ABN3VQB4_9ACTN